MALFAALAACGGLTPPETGAEPSRAALEAPYPDLLPQDRLDALVRDARAAPDRAVTAQDQLAARAADLRARAAALDGPVIDPAARERLSDAASR